MKVRDTSRGRMYAVSSNPGCTVINGDMAVDIPAGGQSVILALDKKLIIDGDDNAKFVEVRWGTNAAVGSRPAPSWMGDVLDGIVSIVGADKFDVNYIPAESKLYLVFSLDTTTAQIEEVENLLESVLPSNVVTAIDEMPIGYARLEYLESTGSQWLTTGIVPTSNAGFRVRFSGPLNSSTDWGYLLGTQNVQGKTRFYLAHASNFSAGFGNYNHAVSVKRVENAWAEVNYKSSGLFDVGGMSFVLPPLNFTPLYEFLLFKVSYYRNSPSDPTKPIRIFEFELTEGEQVVCKMVPAIDKSTGTVGMFDLVNRVFKTNKGTGDFIYPGKETEATTYSLRNRMYAQYTEHGIRRLYHVPDGYSSNEEYAEQNGFKLLIETPRPEEGHWAPVWHDREDCIELEWIETEEHPAEEELQIEEIENA